MGEGRHPGRSRPAGAGVSRLEHHLDTAALALSTLLRAEVTPAPADLSTLADRDAVVTGLRGLAAEIAGVTGAPYRLLLTVRDLTERPAQSLEHALAGLPRLSPLQVHAGLPEPDSPTDYQRLWRQAARACLAFELQHPQVRRLPSEQAWYLLRDTADLAASLPSLDRGLADSLLPAVRAERPKVEATGATFSTPATTAYRLLEDRPGHGTLRLVASEIRFRIRPLHDDRRQAQPSARQPWPALTDPPSRLQTVLDRLSSTLEQGAGLSTAELRGVVGTVRTAVQSAAAVCDHFAADLPQADRLAAALRELDAPARDLALSGARSARPPRIPLLQQTTALSQGLQAIGRDPARLRPALPAAAGPGPQDPAALARQYARPALDVANRLPRLVRALDAALQAGLADGSVLVPNRTDRRTLTPDWVTVRMATHAGDQEPPAASYNSGLLLEFGRTLPAALAQVLPAHGPQAGEPERAVSATALRDARRSTASAFGQLRTTLTLAGVDQPQPAVRVGHPRDNSLNMHHRS